jgi:signal transduction histidine kinase
VKLTGLGLAILLSEGAGAARPPAVIEGSLSHLSPEQTGRTNRPIDTRSDLYALGVVFYQMLTGRLPFEASDPVEWVHCHVARAPTPLQHHVPDVPEAISQIVMRLLAKAPEDRYQTARGLEHDLLRCLEGWRDTGSTAPFPLGTWEAPSLEALRPASAPEEPPLHGGEAARGRPPSASLADASTFTERSEHIDLLAAIKASQTISGELLLDRLAGTLLCIVLEQGGAQRACLVLARGDELSLEAEAVVSDGSGATTRLFQGVPIDSTPLLPASLIRLAQRTREPVILGDETPVDSRLARDPYVLREQPRSILCLPILRGESLLGLLYLEHRSVSGAFTADRMAALSLMASQAAISLENALLLSKVRSAQNAVEDAQGALRVSEARVQDTLRLESIGRLAGGIAHDFNNLLTVILSGAAALRGDFGAGGSASGEIVQEIEGAALRARDLTRQLLAFARRQVTAPVPVDLNALVLTAEKLLRRVLDENVEIATVLEPALWTARCDPGQLEQVLLNLGANARDAMPRGGRLTIETANVLVDGDMVADRPFMRPGPYARLTVRDTGGGMTPEVKEHAFEPFYTTKPFGQGTGLGLATVYGIVKQNGGYVFVDSEPGQGTKFDLFFSRTFAAPAERPAAREQAAQGGTETVLVVEDNAGVAQVTVRALRSAGYRVLIARDGPQALEIAGGEKGRIDLLVTDLVMPGPSGHEVARELRERRAEMKLLYMSGYPRDGLARNGMLDGADFLPKPFTPASLLARVRQILDRGGVDGG